MTDNRFSEKDFDGWNERKKKLHQRLDVPFFHRRELWWCSLGVNVGFEQDGTGNEYSRPVLILKGLSERTCLVVPLTTSMKSHRLRPSVGVVENKEARALLSQMRVIDTKRFMDKIGYLDQKIFEKIQKDVKDIML